MITIMYVENETYRLVYPLQQAQRSQVQQVQQVQQAQQQFEGHSTNIYHDINYSLFYSNFTAYRIFFNI